MRKQYKPTHVRLTEEQQDRIMKLYCKLENMKVDQNYNLPKPADDDKTRVIDIGSNEALNAANF